MPQADFDETALTAFLELGGSEMRQALLAQVRSDLIRCDTALAELSQSGDMAALCRAAHEIKGLAATIGAFGLRDLAEKSEAACAARNADDLANQLPDLRDMTRAAEQSLLSLMQV